jgi:hypothetical protein
MDLETRAAALERDAIAVAGQRAMVQTMTDREMKAIELKSLGATWLQIALAVGLKTAGAGYKFVMTALAKRASQIDSTPVSVARALMMERYEALITASMPAAAMGDDKQAKIALDALKGQARLLGLDAPRKLDVNVHGEEMPADRREREERVRTNLEGFQGRTIDGETA